MKSLESMENLANSNNRKKRAKRANHVTSLGLVQNPVKAVSLHQVHELLLTPLGFVKK